MSEENKDIEGQAEREEEVVEKSEEVDGGLEGVEIDEGVVEEGIREVMAERIEELQGQLQDAGVELEQSKQTIEYLERRQKIGQILAASDAVDLEVAALLTEVAVSEMDEPDVETAIKDLKRQKPYLFGKRGVGGATGSAMAARARTGVVGDMGEAARRAVVSGDRRDLLAYMRKRRGKK